MKAIQNETQVSDLVARLSPELAASVLAELGRTPTTTDCDWLLVAEAAQHARVSPSTMRYWLQVGRLKGYRAGRRVRIRRIDLESFLAGGAL